MTDFLAADLALLAMVVALLARWSTKYFSPSAIRLGQNLFAVLASAVAVLTVVMLWQTAQQAYQADLENSSLGRLNNALAAVIAFYLTQGLLSVVLWVLTAFCLFVGLLGWGQLRASWSKTPPGARVVANGPWQAGFLEAKEIADLLQLENGLPLGLTSSGRMVRYAKNDDAGWLGGHHAVISATRGGKGVSTIIPAIFDHDGPVVALDIKGELARITHTARTAKGQKVVVFDPFETSGVEAHGFNPMSFVRSDHRDRDAAAIAEGLVMPETGSGEHFADRARACLQTVIEVVHELHERPTLHAVRELILNANFVETLESWAQEPRLAGGRAATLAGSFLSMSERERGSILSTVAKSLEWTGSEKMRNFLAVEKGFRFDLLLKGKFDLFIVVPLDQVGAQAGFMRLMANLLLTVMVQQDKRGTVQKTVLFVADEFTRLGYLRRFSDIATVAAGIGLETVFVLQDKASLDRLYPDAATLLASCATLRLFNLGRGDLQTAEWASNLTGHRTLQSHSYTTAPGTTGRSLTVVETRDALLSPFDLLEMKHDEMICFIRGKKPLKLNRIIWFKHKSYKG